MRASFLDTYVLEFLDLPQQYSENNLRKAIIENLKQFILEFGEDFTFFTWRLLTGLKDKLRELTELALESSEVVEK